MHPGRRAVVRSATADLHARAESEISSYAPPNTPEGYVQFLTVMHSVLTAFAEPLDRGADVVGLPGRSDDLRSALRSDLGGNQAVEPVEIHRLTNDAFALGVAYALEGSAMGAKQIRAQVAAHYVGPTRYLDLLLADRAQRWPKFVAGLDHSSLDHLDVVQVVTGANAVFNHIVASTTRSATATSAVTTNHQSRISL